MAKFIPIPLVAPTVIGGGEVDGFSAGPYDGQRAVVLAFENRCDGTQIGPLMLLLEDAINLRSWLTMAIEAQEALMVPPLEEP